MTFYCGNLICINYFPDQDCSKCDLGYKYDKCTCGNHNKIMEYQVYNFNGTLDNLKITMQALLDYDFDDVIFHM